MIVKTYLRFSFALAINFTYVQYIYMYYILRIDTYRIDPYMYTYLYENLLWLVLNKIYFSWYLDSLSIL